jgi:hypothetical protein
MFLSSSNVITPSLYRWHPATAHQCMPLVTMSDLGGEYSWCPPLKKPSSYQQNPRVSPPWLWLWISVSDYGFSSFPESVTAHLFLLWTKIFIGQDKLLRTRISKDTWQGHYQRSKVVFLEKPHRDWQCYLRFCMTACWELLDNFPSPG